MTVDAVVVREEDGRYSAFVPALPGCATWGDTLEELRSNLREATEGWLEVKDEYEMERRTAEAKADRRRSLKNP